jgi:hypothetical protein
VSIDRLCRTGHLVPARAQQLDVAQALFGGLEHLLGLVAQLRFSGQRAHRRLGVGDLLQGNPLLLGQTSERRVRRWQQRLRLARVTEQLALPLDVHACTRHMRGQAEAPLQVRLPQRDLPGLAVDRLDLASPRHKSRLGLLQHVDACLPPVHDGLAPGHDTPRKVPARCRALDALAQLGHRSQRRDVLHQLRPPPTVRLASLGDPLLEARFALLQARQLLGQPLGRRIVLLLRPPGFVGERPAASLSLGGASVLGGDRGQLLARSVQPRGCRSSLGRCRKQGL